MIEKSKWIERKFEYKAPVGEFPCIVARLRGTPARLDEIINSLPPEILTIQTDGDWSIQEHVGHLEDVEELLDSRIDDFIARKDTLTPADLSGRITSGRNHNEKSIALLLESFRTTRMGIVNRLEALDDDIVGHVALHPRLNKPMRAVDMAFFFAEHDDHHIATIIELSRKLQKK